MPCSSACACVRSDCARSCPRPRRRDRSAPARRARSLRILRERRVRDVLARAARQCRRARRRFPSRGMQTSCGPRGPPTSSRCARWSRRTWPASERFRNRGAIGSTSAAASSRAANNRNKTMNVNRKRGIVPYRCRTARLSRSSAPRGKTRGPAVKFTTVAPAISPPAAHRAARSRARTDHRRLMGRSPARCRAIRQRKQHGTPVLDAIGAMHACGLLDIRPAHSVCFVAWGSD